jgi:hypothetical protein
VHRFITKIEAFWRLEMGQYVSKFEVFK